MPFDFKPAVLTHERLGDRIVNSLLIDAIQLLI